MGRKRGGLAGIWDRNKKIIKPIASGIAGAVGGPWAGAALGSLMNGLDREGKSGIGFDAKQGVTGAISGYGAGKLGQMGRGALSKAFSSGIGTTGAAGASPIGIGVGTPTSGLPVDPEQWIANGAVESTTAPFRSSMPLQGGIGSREISSGAANSAARSTAAGFNSLASTPEGSLSAVTDATVGGGGGGASGLRRVWDTVKPQMGTNKDGSSAGNIGAYGAALNYLGGQRGAAAESRLTDAQAAKLEYENEQQRRKDESMQKLREMLSASMPNFGNGVATSPWNK